MYVTYRKKIYREIKDSERMDSSRIESTKVIKRTGDYEAKKDNRDIE